MCAKIKKAFTLIELVVVIAVIAILSAVAVASYVGVTNNASKALVQSEITDMKNLYLTYYTLEGNKEDDIRDDLDKFVSYCYNNGLKENSINYYVANEVTPNIQTLSEENSTVISNGEVIFLLKGSDGSNFYGSFSVSTENGKLTQKCSSNEETIILKGLENITNSTIGKYISNPTLDSWEYLFDENGDFQITEKSNVKAVDNEGNLLANLSLRKGKKIDSLALSKLLPNSLYYVTKEKREGFNLSNDGYYYYLLDNLVWKANGKIFDFNQPLNEDNLELKLDVDDTIKVPEFNSISKVEQFKIKAIKSWEKGNFKEETDYDNSLKEFYYFDDLQTAIDFSSSFEAKVLKNVYKVTGTGCDDDPYVKTNEILRTETKIQTLHAEVLVTKSCEITDMFLDKNKTLSLKINNNQDIVNVYSAADKEYASATELQSREPAIKLTLKGNSKIKGTMNVGANVLALSNSIQGNKIVPVGSLLEEHDYNELVVSENSTLTVENSGRLNIYGKASGEGQIIINGGQLFEICNIRDHRGGGNIMGCGLNKVFPFLFYELNHNEVDTLIYANSEYKAYIPLREGDGTNRDSYINFVSTKEDSLFQIKKGYIVKSINRGKTIFDIYGDVYDREISLEVSEMNINLAEIEFPISNFNINVKKGSNLYLYNLKFKILPNSTITVDEGANLFLNTGVVAFDKFNYYNEISMNNYAKFYKEQFESSNEGELIINGSINIGKNAYLAGKINLNGKIENSSKNFNFTIKEGFQPGRTASFVSSKENGTKILLSLNINDENLEPLKLLNLNNADYKLKIDSDDQNANLISIDENNKITINNHLENDVSINIEVLDKNSEKAFNIIFQLKGSK